MREQPLLDEQNGVAGTIKRDGAVMPRPALEGDIHAIGFGNFSRGKNRGLTNLDFHPADFVSNLPVNRLLAEVAKVGISGQPIEIAVAELKGFLQCKHGAVELPGKRAAAREIVKNERIVRFKAREALVHFQALGVTPASCVVVAQKLQCVHVIRIAADKPLHEFNPGVEVALAGAT
jgi:hypothetical protein